MFEEWTPQSCNGEVGVFRAYDALEHLRDPIHTMKELHRCLAPQDWLLSQTPSTDGRGASLDGREAFTE